MSNKYTIGGYKIAVRAKSKKTLLVEGKDDKEFFVKYRQEKFPDQQFDVDSADILSDSSLSGLGAKSKIDFLLGTIPEGSPIYHKLRVFVDREWESLTDQSTNQPVIWTPPFNRNERLTTCGHSFENYSFDVDFVLCYLSHFGSGLYTKELASDITSYFPQITSLSASFSDEIRRASVISRCYDMVDVSDILVDSTSLSISDSIADKMRQRGIEDPINLVSNIRSNHKNKWGTLPFLHEAHHHAHGHIGEDIVWSSVGKLAEIRGFGVHICNELARGRRDERRRFWHTWLTSSDRIRATSICQAFS